MKETQGADYTARLIAKSAAGWKRVLDVQAPYRWNLQRQRLGRTIDVGCGIGRNLSGLADGSIGIDHNEGSVAEARRRGLMAKTVNEWRSAPPPTESFDGLLLSHIVEHMPLEAALSLVDEYVPYLRPGGRVFFVCPQERGYRSDRTHVRFTSGPDLANLARASGLVPDSWQSFPLPRFAGPLFTYNEFTLLAHKPLTASPR